MYLPRHFRADGLDELHAFIERHPLAALISAANGSLDADHVPMLLDRAQGPRGTLRGHVARANDLWRRLADDRDVLVIFQGAEAYVSPTGYAAKRTTGAVVPTWNYAVVHVRGRIRFFDDAARLLALVSALTSRHEAGRPEPWSVSDAPAEYVQSMLRAIVGFEIEILAAIGKFKASQNRSDEDRLGVGADLRGSHDAAAVDELVRVPAGRTPEDR